MNYRRNHNNKVEGIATSVSTPPRNDKIVMLILNDNRIIGNWDLGFVWKLEIGIWKFSYIVIISASFFSFISFNSSLRFTTVSSISLM